MGGRPDPWLPGAVLLVHKHEAALLLPVVEAGLREWQRMGAVSKLEAAADLLARWRHLAEAHDRQLTGSAAGTAVGGGVEDRAGSRRDGSHMSTSAAADRLGCSTRWVRILVGRGEIDGYRGAGGCWNVDAASVARYRDRVEGDRPVTARPVFGR